MSTIDKLPKKILKCPIAESILEIRYNSEIPTDAIFGIIYAAIKNKFKDSKPITLPILQLPESVRKKDPNFIYQAHHRLVNNNLSVSIGPKVVTFNNSSPYIGWKKWSDYIINVLNDIKQTNVINIVERIGLRYINFFDINILEKANLKIDINNDILKDESTSLRTEIIDSNFIKILHIGNSVNISVNNIAKNGSIIDIDCITNLNDNENKFFNNYKDIFEEAHKKEKELFYSLLKESFIQELEPIY
ncbi:MAG: TIGR04255 family protein [Spirochaetes bacterium]|nr:TIGR04255 family protein [Spirochaetota bacterium]